MENNIKPVATKLKSKFSSERGEIGDSFIMIVAFMLAALLMFIFPLMTMADRTDDVTQMSVKTATTEFVNKMRTTGKITPDDYNQFMQVILSTGNTYDVEIEVKVLDENPGKKTVQVEREKIGENEYYAVFTAQVLNVIAPETGTPQTYPLKEGDIISVKVKNISLTLAQQLKNFFYTVIGNNTYTIAAEDGGIVTVTGF